MELDGRYASGLLDFHGIHIAVDVGLHNGHADFVLDSVNQLDKCGRLAASGRGHQVQEKHTFLFQFRTQCICILFIVGKDTFLDFDDSYFIHNVM